MLGDEPVQLSPRELPLVVALLQEAGPRAGPELEAVRGAGAAALTGHDVNWVKFTGRAPLASLLLRYEGAKPW